MKNSIAGKVVWYVTGRFYLSPNNTLEDAGYFIFLDGIKGDLFSGDIGETTAHFTFRSQPFKSETVTNGAMKLALDAAGVFSLYFQAKPAANFAKPDTFSSGQEIARFRRVSVVMNQTLNTNNEETTSGLFTTNVFTATLVSSQKFTYQGKTYNPKKFFPNGITQWGTASPEPVGKVKGYTSVVPFAASAIAL
jgi:hypothetical protein